MFQACRLFHAVVSAHLPLTIYKMILRLNGDKDSAILSAIYISTSVHLKVLGTHTLVNSFMAPFVFFTLSTLIFQTTAFGETTVTNTKCANALCQRRKVAKAKNNNICKGKCSDTQDKCGSKIQRDKVTSRRLASLSCLWTGTNEIHQMQKNFCCGLTIGIICYMRVDTTLFFSVSLICFVPYSKIAQFLTTKNGIIIILAFCVSFSFGGFVDNMDYGVWFVSPAQWLNFNVFTDKATVLFSGRHSMYYFEMLFISRITIAIQVASIFLAFRPVARQNPVLESNKNFFNNALLAFLILFIIYDIKIHKELRFVHNVIVLFHVAAGSATALVLQEARKWIPCKITHSVLLFSLASLLVGDSWTNFPRNGNENFSKWKYKNNSISNDLNAAFYFVSQQEDVTGVFCDQSLYDSAAFTLLHQEVPLFIKIHHEFQEFTRAAAKSIAAGTLYLKKGEEIYVSILNRVSNFFTEENYPEIVKYLLENKDYNYLVINEASDAFRNHYRTVYSKGDVTVLKLHDNNTEVGLNEFRNNSKMNVTLLEYEGSWLITFGLPQVAVDHLETGLLNDRSNVRIFQLLAKAYMQLNKTNVAQNVLNQCISIHGVHTCHQTQPRVQLHADYNSNIDFLF